MLLNLQDGGLPQRLIVVSFSFAVLCTGCFCFHSLLLLPGWLVCHTGTPLCQMVVSNHHAG